MRPVVQVAQCTPPVGSPLVEVGIQPPLLLVLARLEQRPALSIPKMVPRQFYREVVQEFARSQEEVSWVPFGPQDPSLSC